MRGDGRPPVEKRIDCGWLTKAMKMSSKKIVFVGRSALISAKRTRQSERGDLNVIIRALFGSLKTVGGNARVACG